MSIAHPWWLRDSMIYFSDGDLHILRWAYKHTRELARRMPMYRGEVASEHPEFPEGSEAIAHAAEGPVSVSAPKIGYTEADNKAIDEFNKRFGKFLSCSWQLNRSDKWLPSWNDLALCK